MAQFTVTITLGNDTMQGPDDVADALRTLADNLWTDDTGTTHPVRDPNGNTVGHWQVTDS